MKKVLLLLCSFLVLVLFSCNNRAARESNLKDLESNQNRLSQFKQDIEKLSSDIKNAQVDLEVAKDNLDNAKIPKFLRTPEEREDDIRNATKAIQQIESTITNANQKIIVLNDSVSQTETRISNLKEVLKN